MTRIRFSMWGRGVQDLTRARYAVRQEWESAVAAVGRSLERTTGLRVCAGPRWDGTALERGQPEAEHYQITLGTPCRGGGWAPVCEVWISIPVGL